MSKMLWVVAASFIGLMPDAFAVDPVTLPGHKELGPTAVKPVYSDSERYGLVGVIAEGDKNQKGIAVISDLLTSKSLTLRVGDVMPGNAEFTLTNVSRNLAVLEGRGQVIHIRTAVGSYQEPRKTGSVGESMAPNFKEAFGSGPVGGIAEDSGLLERWAQERADTPTTEHFDEVTLTDDEEYQVVFKADPEQLGREDESFTRPDSTGRLPVRYYDDAEIRAMIELGRRREIDAHRTDTLRP